MDVIGLLSLECDLPEEQARALAGGILGMVQEELEAQYGFEAERSFSAEVPEVESWRVDALRYFGRSGKVTHGTPKFSDRIAEVVGDGETVSQAMVAGAAGGVGTAEEAMVRAMLQELYRQPLRSPALDNIVATHAGLVAPIVLVFLKSRLSRTLFEQVLDVSPMLASIATEGGTAMGSATGTRYVGLMEEP